MALMIDIPTQRVMSLEGTLQGKFEAYHFANPNIYERFKDLAFIAAAKGRKRIGAKLIMERLRWDTMIEGKDDYKINNNYTSRYVRMFLDEYPDMRDLFCLRELKS